jgi:LysM repeat protein
VRALLVVMMLCATAEAGEHVVQRGETLEHVAQQYGCTVEAVLRANRLDNVLVKPGTVVQVPSCSMKTRARTRERITESTSTTRTARVRLSRSSTARR